MSIAKSLTEEQIESIRRWAESRDGLPEIQRKLASEFDVKVTYLETRFLLEDLKIELLPEPVEEPEAESDEDATGDREADSEAEDDLSGDSSGVSVTVDKIQRPGAIVSGKAHFPGGNSGSWWLDQMGRLGFDPDQEGFSPSEDELMAFQQQLQAAIQKRGF